MQGDIYSEDYCKILQNGPTTTTTTTAAAAAAAVHFCFTFL